MDEFYHLDSNGCIMFDIYDKDMHKKFVSRLEPTHFLGIKVFWIQGISKKNFLDFIKIEIQQQ